MNLAAKRLKEAQGRVAVVVDAVVCKREGTEQPAPDGALMIDSVTIARTASVMAGVSRLTGRETPQPMRG